MNIFALLWGLFATQDEKRNENESKEHREVKFSQSDRGEREKHKEKRGKNEEEEGRKHKERRHRDKENVYTDTSKKSSSDKRVKKTTDPEVCAD